MTESNGHAVFFFPKALEALGDAIQPYLQDSPAGPHVLCSEIDTGGTLLEMTIQGVARDGSSVVLDLMVPTSMVRMIVSSQSDDSFGFGPRDAAALVGVPPGAKGDAAAVSSKASKAVAKPAKKGKPQAGNESSTSKPVKRKPAKGKTTKGKPVKSTPARPKRNVAPKT